MDDNELQQKWPELKEKIKILHPELSEEDLRLELGRDTDLLLRLQQKLKKTNKEIRNWLSLLG